MSALQNNKLILFRFFIFEKKNIFFYRKMSVELSVEIETTLFDLLQDKNILTFGSVSAELGVHVNLAKNYLEQVRVCQSFVQF